MRIQPTGGDPGPISPPVTPQREAENADVSIPFVLDSGDYRFAPDVFPNTLRTSKSRSLNRKKNFCGGEDVSDQGGKNKEIHVSGYVNPSQTGDIWDLANYAQTIELTSPIWSGEVRIDEAEVSGPGGYDPETETFYWQYTLDLVSTGTDEPNGPTNEDGIISEGP